MRRANTAGGLIGYWLPIVFILAYIGVLSSSLFVQLVLRDMPCPLCMLQRYVMLLVCLGPVTIVRSSHRGALTQTGMVRAYSFSILAALMGMVFSARQILLHICGQDPGYGPAVLGLHLYSWGLVTFFIVIAASAIALAFSHSLLPQTPVSPRVGSAVLYLFFALAVAIAVLAIAELGFNFILPDNPAHYNLFP